MSETKSKSSTIITRKVVANISLSLDGRVTGPGGEYDMGWIVPHAITNAARDNMISITMTGHHRVPGKEKLYGFWKLLA